MNKKQVLPQGLFVDFSPNPYDPEAFGKAIREGMQPPKAASVVVDSMERVVELYDRQEAIAPTHAVINSRELFEFLGSNEGRCNWAATILGHILGPNFSPRYKDSWSGAMYSGLSFFAFALSIPFADPDLVSENYSVPEKGTLVHLTVFEFNGSEL